MIVGGFPPNKLALHSFGGKPFKFAALCAVHSTGAVGTTRAALMAAPVNLAGLRDQLQKGRVFDSREAFVTAVQLFAHREHHHVRQQCGAARYARYLCATVPRRGVKEHRRDTPNGGCLFAVSAVCNGDKWVVCKSTLSKTCGSDRHTLRGDIVARMSWARQAAATFKRGQTKKASLHSVCTLVCNVLTRGRFAENRRHGFDTRRLACHRASLQAGSSVKTSHDWGFG